MHNAFTVDVEDYFQVGAFADQIPSSTWDQFEGRVERSTQSVLDLLDRHQVRATFFILGWTAKKYPDLVRAIQKAGHDIGSHSYWHRNIYDLTPDQFRDDLLQSCQVLQDITGEKITQYRAPSFSVTSESLWALDILIEAGIEYDSSIFPIHHDRYGIPDAEPFPYRIEKPSGSMWEFPPSIFRLGKFNIPVAGGGYFRLYPARFSIACLKRVNRSSQQPFMFYIHPWELDPEQPRMQGKLRSRFRHYQNLASTERKLDRLLDSFSFGSMTDALSQCPGLLADSPESPQPQTV